MRQMLREIMEISLVLAVITLVVWCVLSAVAGYTRLY